MAKKAKNCVLKYLKNPSKLIPLPDNVIVYLGRNRDTMITDTLVSKKQLSATANYSDREVSIETLGINSCGCNGYALRKDKVYKLKHGDRIELILGNHEFDVIFDHEIEDSCDEPDAKKAKVNYSIFNLSKDSVALKNSKDHYQSGGSGSWETIDNGALLIYTYCVVKSQPKIAAFDLDGTLIRTKSGARFAKNSEDWILNFSEVKSKLHNLLDEDYKIVVFTNQGGIKSDSTKRNDFKRKAEAILSSIQLPIQLFAATTNSVYRKPVTGMWEILCSEKNDQVRIDLENSFYVGDAAGREKDWAPKKSKDHSIADRLFAMNVGLKFYTPEEFFLGSRSVSHIMPKFDPKSLSIGNNVDTVKDECEVVVMVGSPGAGKSHYCKHNLIQKGYIHVNRDSLGSWQSCVKLLEKSIQKGERVVIDNTNGDKATRKRYIDLAKKLNVPCRCFVMTTSPEHCKHNNKFRQITDKTHIPVGEMVLNIYKKNYEEPVIDEGFNEIVKIDFIPEFESGENEKLYKMFLLES